MMRMLPVFMLSVSLAMAGESKPRAVVQVVAELSKECDKPTTPNEPEMMSYLSATERIRWNLLCELAAIKEAGIPLVKAERTEAEKDVRTREAIERKGKALSVKPEDDLPDMLTIALALMGDTDSVAETAKLLPKSKTPAVRVCAARALRQLKDKSTIPALKDALHDPYKREDGACCKTDNGMCHPVRIIAWGALAEMGLTLDEVKKIMAEEEKQTPQGAEANTREPRR
jgi:hypothetical protein